jgi:hypothetical protein
MMEARVEYRLDRARRHGLVRDRPMTRAGICIEGVRMKVEWGSQWDGKCGLCVNLNPISIEPTNLLFATQTELHRTLSFPQMTLPLHSGWE